MILGWKKKKLRKLPRLCWSRNFLGFASYVSKMTIYCKYVIAIFIRNRFAYSRLVFFTTDLGSLIGNFEHGYSTVWKIIFLATLILGEINFVWYQRVKYCRFYNFGGFEFWVYGNFTLENVRSCQKFKIQSCWNGQSCSFCGFKMTKIDFTWNINCRNILNILNYPIENSQLGCPGLY